MAVLLIVGGFLPAQDLPGSGKLSITVSNQSVASLTLGLREMPSFLLPSRQTSLSTAPQQMPLSAEPNNDPAHRINVKPTTIQPNQSATLELPPRQYHLYTMGPWLNGKLVRPLDGYISVTNAEVWPFKLEEKDEEIRGPALHWKLEVPARSGFHLSPSPEWPKVAPTSPSQEGLKILPNALRPPPVFPQFVLPRAPSTNLVK